MSETQKISDDQLTKLTTNIVLSYLSHHSTAPTELPRLLHGVHAALKRMTAPPSPAAPAVEKPTPAQVRKSIRPEGIVSFINGKSYKTLRRHLEANGLDETGYRERFGLPRDYPMVAQSYSEQRSNLARSNGLGRGGRTAPDAAPRRDALAPKPRRQPSEGLAAVMGGPPARAAHAAAPSRMSRASASARAASVSHANMNRAAPPMKV